MTSLQLTNLRIGFNRLLIEVASMEISQGLHYVLGANGVGKSAFFSTLSGNLPALSGEIIFGQKNITDVPPFKRSDIVAWLPQKTEFGQFVSVHEFMDSNFHSHQSFFNEWDIKPLMEFSPQKLSQGEQQRLALTHFFMKDREIYLLDEPFTSLDLQYQQKLKNKISNLHNKLILLTHHSPLLNLKGIASVIFIYQNRCEKIENPLQNKEAILKAAENSFNLKFQFQNHWLLPLVVH